MPEIETADSLLTAAKRDLHVLKNMTDPEAFPIEAFGFHAQQAVEKALKAWLCIRSVAYRRSHNLRYLLALLDEAGDDVSRWWEFVDLSAFAVQFRYDAFDAEDYPLDRGELIERTVALVDHVSALLRAASSKD